MWNINESFAIEVKGIGRFHFLILVLVLVEIVVSQGVLEVLVSAIHLESDALVDKHLVLTLTWKLEAFVREDDVLPDLWNLDVLHIDEFFGVVVLIPLDAIKFTKLESEKEELVRIFNQVVQNVDNFESHLLDLNQLNIGLLDSLVLNLIDLVLCLHKSLQELRDLSTLKSVVHL